MNNWVTLKLKDIGSIHMCKRILKSQTSTTGDIPFYKIKTFGKKPDAYISRELFIKYKTKFNFPKLGDILISAAGTLGKTVRYNGEDAYFQDSNIVWLDNDESKLLNDYLYYYYQTKPWIITSGSTISRLYNKDIENLTITFPKSKELQSKIISILKNIDQKIANNNAISQELDSMAKTIYDYWFLQFEFPNEEGKPYKSSGGKMVWNEQLKRKIPEKWNIEDIQKICDVVDCLHSKKPDYKFESEEYYLLTLDNLSKYGLIDNSKKFFISKKDYQKWTSRIEIKDGDFVVTNAGRSGDISRVPASMKAAIGRNLTAIRPIKISSDYLDMFFKSEYTKAQIKSNLDSGSFFYSYNVKSIKKLRILVPDNETMKLYLQIFSPLLKKIEIIMKENQQLQSLRDFLLPMLMNGQVTLKDK